MKDATLNATMISDADMRALISRGQEMRAAYISALLKRFFAKIRSLGTGSNGQFGANARPC